MQQITQLSAKVLTIDHMADQNAQGGEAIATATVQLFNLSAEMMTKLKTYQTTSSNTSLDDSDDWSFEIDNDASDKPKHSRDVNIDDDDNIELF